MFSASQIYSMVDSFIILRCPDKNFDSVEREIPARVHSLEVVKLCSFIKLVILNLIATDNSIIYNYFLFSNFLKLYQNCYQKVLAIANTF